MIARVEAENIISSIGLNNKESEYSLVYQFSSIRGDLSLPLSDR